MRLVQPEYSNELLVMKPNANPDLLTHFSKKYYICGDDYTIADIVIWAWYGRLVRGELYDAAEFFTSRVLSTPFVVGKRISRCPLYNVVWH